jgi:hypothetical protein
VTDAAAAAADDDDLVLKLSRHCVSPPLIFSDHLVA